MGGVVSPLMHPRPFCTTTTFAATYFTQAETHRDASSMEALAAWVAAPRDLRPPPDGPHRSRAVVPASRGVAGGAPVVISTGTTVAVKK